MWIQSDKYIHSDVAPFIFNRKNNRCHDFSHTIVIVLLLNTANICIHKCKCTTIVTYLININKINY